MIDDVSAGAVCNHKMQLIKCSNVILQVTGEPLIRRSDDNVDALKKRLNSYHTQTKPLVDYYALKGLHFKVDAAKSAATVFGNIDGIFLRKRSARV